MWLLSFFHPSICAVKISILFVKVAHSLRRPIWRNFWRRGSRSRNLPMRLLPLPVDKKQYAWFIWAICKTNLAFWWRWSRCADDVLPLFQSHIDPRMYDPIASSIVSRFDWRLILSHIMPWEYTGYTIGTEANCDQSLCCRPGTFTYVKEVNRFKNEIYSFILPFFFRTQVPPGQLLLPAPRFGAYLCDTPWLLANAVMHAIGPLTGVNPEDSNGKSKVSFPWSQSEANNNNNWAYY